MKIGKARLARLPWSCRMVIDVLLIAASVQAADWIGGPGQAIAQENLPVLTQVTDVRRLSPTEARRGYPVRLRGVVTFNQPGVTFIQDTTAGIYLVTLNSPIEAQAGDLVEARGITGPGEFAPVVDRPQVRILGRGEFPIPRRVPVEALFTGNEDSQWVELRGIVHSVGVDRRLPPGMNEGFPFLDLGITSGNSRFKARVTQFDGTRNYGFLVDSTVALRGVCGTLFNEKRQLVGIQIFVPSVDQMRIEEAARPDPYELPIFPANSLMQFSPEKESGHRIRVQGVVTLNQPGRYLFIQDLSGGVKIESPQNSALQQADRIDAVGFPAAGQYTPILEDGEFRRIGQGILPAPVNLTGATEPSRDCDAQLVKIEGRLIDQVARGTALVLTMQKGGLVFTAELDRSGAYGPAASLRDGSHLQLTGVWSVETDKYRRPTAFRILLRSAGDIVVLERPSWWTASRILGLLGVLAGIILLGALWVVVLRRRVDERTETIRATLESTADGILVIDAAGKVAAHNQKFAEMWHIPDQVLRSRDDRALLDFVLAELKNPEAFIRKIRELYADPEARSDDVLEFKDGRVFERHSEPQRIINRSVGRVWGFRDITQQRHAQEDREKLISELKEALSKVKLLSGLLPICSSCKKIREDSGYWKQIEGYILEHSEVVFSHSICPQCMERLYPEYRDEESETGGRRDW